MPALGRKRNPRLSAFDPGLSFRGARLRLGSVLSISLKCYTKSSIEAQVGGEAPVNASVLRVFRSGQLTPEAKLG